MTLVICTDWVVNSDNTFVFYDTTQYNDFKTGKKTEDNKFEHLVSFANTTPIISTQVYGYQVTIKKKYSFYFILPLGRRLSKDKKFVQLKDDIEILLELKEGVLSTYVEPEPVETPVEEKSE